jgi:Domain of unknown function (DUF4150)
MGDTVSNHDLAVCTKGTDHLATTQGATDVCWDAPHMSAAPYPNYVPTTQLGAGETTKTVISGKPIVTMAGTIEPASDPAHAGVGGGVCSGTYRMEAKPTGASPDVSAEGNKVCRSTDPTTQNHANTTGAFTPPTLDPNLNANKNDQKDRCKIVKVEGECLGGGEGGEGHHRKLGFPPRAKEEGDGYYLEVVSDDSVKLVATRQNAVQKGDPVCPPHLHTKWVIDRSGAGEPPKKQEFISMDELTLDRSFFAIPSIEALDIKSKPKDDVTAKQQAAIADQVSNDNPVTAKEAKIKERMAENDPKLSIAKQQYAQHRDNVRADQTAAMTQEQQEANKKAGENLKTAVEAAQFAAKLLIYWNYALNPVTLQITALACSGSKNVTLKVFPEGDFDFDLFTDKVAENVAKIRAVAAVIQRIAEIFGKKGHFEFLSEPKLKLKVAYKELTESKNGLLKSQCNRAWTLSISMKKLVYFQIEFTIPILNFFGPMGAVANTFLYCFGFEGDAYLSLEISVIPKVEGKWTEYDEWSIGDFSIKIKVKVEIGVRVRWRDIGEIYASGYAECSIDFSDPKLYKDKLFDFKYKGELQVGVKAGGYASWWGFTKSFEFDYKPPDWKYALGEGRMGICYPT